MQESTFPQSKSSLSRLAQVQQFISFKLANPLRSQEEARAMKLKTKYQKQLDKQYKKVDEKMKQLKAREYECKKTKKYVWDMLARYSAANDETDQQTNKWRQRMLRVEEAKQERGRKIKEEKIRVRAQQEKLQRTMEQTTKQSQSEVQKLEQTLEQTIKQIEQATRQCIQIQPQITEHNLQNQYLQTLHQQTLTYRSQIQQFKQNISKSKQFLSVLQNKIYQQFQAKQQDDANRENQCRARIQAMVVHLDGILRNDGQGDWQAIWDKYMLNVKDARDLEKDQKYREVRDKVVGKDSSKSENLHIKQKISEKYYNSIKEIEEQQEQARKQQERLQKICRELEAQENSKDKQIKNLSQTIDKITFNLNK